MLGEQNLSFKMYILDTLWAQPNFFEGHIKDQIEKKNFIFFCLNILKWLTKFRQNFWFDLQDHKDQKGHTKAEYS